MKIVEYFYDGQIRRYLDQIVRAFSGIQYEIITERGKELRTTPVSMAQQNRQVAHILNNNSENTAKACPYITVYIRSVELNRNMTPPPGFVSKAQVTERAYDEATGEYTAARGNSYTVERVAPHPLRVSIGVDVWTSNEHQKHQLFEQIFMAFNVAFTVQNSDNPLDWSAMTDFELVGMDWSSRSIPIGTSDGIDVMSFIFEMPMWINPPAKIKRQKVIDTIITNINHDMEQVDFDDPSGPSTGILGSGDDNNPLVTTPDGAMIRVEGNSIYLLDRSGVNKNNDWLSLINQYGKLRLNTSRIFLSYKLDTNFDTMVAGTIQLTDDPNILHWQPDIDTLPVNTLSDIDGVIDPETTIPQMLPETMGVGTRLLFVNSPKNFDAWGKSLENAKDGDIVELGTSGVWFIAFNSDSKTEEFVTNKRSGKQLRFDKGEWSNSIDSEYGAGYWRLKL